MALNYILCRYYFCPLIKATNEKDESIEISTETQLEDHLIYVSPLNVPVTYKFVSKKGRGRF